MNAQTSQRTSISPPTSSQDAAAERARTQDDAAKEKISDEGNAKAATPHADVYAVPSQVSSHPSPSEEAAVSREDSPPSVRWKRLALPIFHVVLWMLMTGWFVTGVALHRDLGWVVPLLVWLGVSARLITWYIPSHKFTKPVKIAWKHVVLRPLEVLEPRWRLPLGAAGTVGVILLGTFVPLETADNTRADRAVSLFGLVVALASFYATSRDRRKVKFQTVIGGVLAQFILALFVLKTKVGSDIFTFIADLARTLLGFSADGTSFITDPSVVKLTWFLVLVVPPIIFFIAFIQLLSHWGITQWAVQKFAVVFFHTLGVSGAEAVVAAASPFIGQGESVMLIRPYIPLLTRAEVHQVMASGFATIAGSVLYAYISMGVSPTALVSSCVMSIPASLAMSKLRYPETEEPLTAGEVVIPEGAQEDRHHSALQAFSEGAGLGIRIAGMIIAGVLTILALLGLVNGLLGWWGSYLGIDDPKLSVKLIAGYIFYPVAFLLGVERNGDLLKVAQLIGMKVVANEFVAYDALQHNLEYASLAPRSRLIATYALCGFGNLASVGIQIGVLSQLAATRARDVARVALSALATGVVATLTSAAIAGMLVVEPA